MKKNHITSASIKTLIIAFLFLCNNPFLSSQVTVTVTGTCVGSFTIPANGTLNGKNRYTGPVTLGILSTTADLFWNSASSRWEITSAGTVLFFNNTNTPLNPPCVGNGVWSADGFCSTFGGSTFISSSGNCTIPVELLDFSVKNTNTTNEIKWQTATEIKNKGFEIERSNDGKSWQSVSFVVAKGNNSIYTFTDKTPLPMSYYRLRQMDFDGQFEYSKVVVAKLSHQKSTVLVFPNPNTEGVIHIQGLPNEETNLSITNIYGQTVFQQKATTESVALNVKNILSAGVYFVNVKTSNGLMTEKITLQ
jgi:hypothetical protein